MITFRSLTPPTLRGILDMQLGDLHKRLAEQHLTLKLAESALERILEVGHDPVNGARPLRRAVERLLVRPLSAAIVEDTFAPGSTIVAHAGDDGRLNFEAEAAA